MKLVITHLRKKWPETDIDFSAEVERGTMLAVCGHSGSGKSTVLRMIAGLLPVDGGSIMLDGKEIAHLKPVQRKIGMVFQSHALFPHLPVVDNVAYGLVSRGERKKAAREKAASFLKSFGFDVTPDFLRRYPEEISGGEAQRVSLARTLIVKPEIVLFDEPLSSIDVPLRRKLAAEIRNYQKEFGFTGIYVTHDIAEAKAVAGWVTVLHNGVQTWSGAPGDFDEQKLTELP